MVRIGAIALLQRKVRVARKRAPALEQICNSGKTPVESVQTLSTTRGTGLEHRTGFRAGRAQILDAERP